MEEALFGIGEMGGIELWEVVEAYYECRRRKRRTVNAMKFELDWETEAIRLWQEINNGTYRPGRSIAFRGEQTNEERDIRSRLPRPCGASFDLQKDTALAGSKVYRRQLLYP